MFEYLRCFNRFYSNDYFDMLITFAEISFGFAYAKVVFEWLSSYKYGFKIKGVEYEKVFKK